MTWNVETRVMATLDSRVTHKVDDATLDLCIGEALQLRPVHVVGQMLPREQECEALPRASFEAH